METRLPLSSISVVDLTRNVAGPWAAMVLADLGADVVKVEQPQTGDDTRHWGPPFWGGESPVFLALNRNKRSLTLDLREPEARPVMERLVASTDVILESFRPGALERLGYGYEWAADRNARIIYCSITSYGEQGPLRDRPGYDPLMQACGGIMSVTGEPGRAPVRAGVSLVDMGTGMWAALAVMAALMRVRETGRGQRVASSLYETALAWMCYHLTTYWAGGEAPGRHGSGTATIAPYEAFAAEDGYLVIAAGNDGLFARLCDALGRPQWLSDARFRHNADRVRHRLALRAEIEAVTRTWRTDRLAEHLIALGLPCSPIRSVVEVAADPQALALGIFQRLCHPAIPDFQSVGLPIVLEGARPQLRRPPPRCGEHNAEVLAEMGFSPEEVVRLLTSPAIGGPPAEQGQQQDAPGRERWTSN
jgi:formyl-CoA transferase/CoA:oxalate CoA-transferase